MSLPRVTAHALLFALPFAIAACSTAEPSGTGADSKRLVVSKTGMKRLTLSTDDGKCGLARSLIARNKAKLGALCDPGTGGAAPREIPMPADVSRMGCGAGNVISITFACVGATPPPMPDHGCHKIEVQDDAHAIGAGTAEHMSSLPPVVCPLLGGTAPAEPGPGLDPEATAEARTTEHHTPDSEGTGGESVEASDPRPGEPDAPYGGSDPGGRPVPADGPLPPAGSSGGSGYGSPPDACPIPPPVFECCAPSYGEATARPSDPSGDPTPDPEAPKR